MFKKFSNHNEANHFVKSLSSLMTFTNFYEDNKEMVYGSSGEFVYTAITDDHKWRMDITFPTGLNNQKNHYPDITFKANGISMGSILSTKGRTIANYFEAIYKPDFNKIFMIIDTFIKTGLESKMIHSVDELWKMWGEGSVQDFFETDNYSQHLRFKGKKASILSFNRLLQKGSGYQQSNFKKSYITVDWIHIVVGNTIQPFFKIKLPFVNEKRMCCIVPINPTETENTKLYFTDDEKKLKYGLFNLHTINMDNEQIESYFYRRFDTVIKNAMCSSLNLKKAELDNISKEELESYFTLLEMVKI